MADTHMVPMERDQLLDAVARLHRQGHSQYEIGKRLGFSQSTVSKMIVEVRKRYQERAAETHADLVEEKCAQLADIRAEAWAAYELSKLPKTKKQEEYGNFRKPKPKDKDEPKGRGKRGRMSLEDQVDHIEFELRKVKETTTVEGQLPSAHYLELIVKCLNLEAELRGLKVFDDPSKGVKVTVDWDALRKRGRATSNDVDEDVRRAIVEGGTVIDHGTNGTNGSG